MNVVQSRPIMQAKYSNVLYQAGLDKWRREKLKHAQSREAALLKTQEKG